MDGVRRSVRQKSDEISRMNEKDEMCQMVVVARALEGELNSTTLNLYLIYI
jgi:hypothetical protein